MIGSLASSNEGVEGYTTMVAVMRGLFMWFPSFGTTLSVIKFLTVAMSDHRCAYFPSEGESLICVPGMGEDWKDYERLIAHCCRKYIFKLRIQTRVHFWRISYVVI